MSDATVYTKEIAKSEIEKANAAQVNQITFEKYLFHYFLEVFFIILKEKEFLSFL
jgi:hypothetical protein